MDKATSSSQRRRPHFAISFWWRGYVRHGCGSEDIDLREYRRPGDGRRVREIYCFDCDQETRLVELGGRWVEV